jgi:hypothetical protein
VNAYVSYALKAIGAAFVTLAGQVIAGVADGSITWQEWLVAVCWSVISGLAVFGIKNGPDPRQLVKPQPPTDEGMSNVGL